MKGRAPKLTPQEQMTLVYKYTTGTSIKELQKMFQLSQHSVERYIAGDFQDPRYQFPTKAGDPNLRGHEATAYCEAGLHSWIDARHRLHPDEKCTDCGEAYGHV